MFVKEENPNAKPGYTKIQWWFGVEYLGIVKVACEWHLKIRQLFAKKQDFDGTMCYVQAPIKDIRAGKVDGLYCSEAEDWANY